jgi:rRNA maturation endonuclease Nob1
MECMMANFINQLQEQVSKLRASRDAAVLNIDLFKLHLRSAKFQGFEYVCHGCGRIRQDDRLRQCPNCGGVLTGHRKDLIAVADVERWLDDIKDKLRG